MARMSEQVALLQDLAGIERSLITAKIPKRKSGVPRFKLGRVYGDKNAIREALMDLHARIPVLLKQVRCGKFGPAAYAVGFAHGIAVAFGQFNHP